MFYGCFLIILERENTFNNYWISKKLKIMACLCVESNSLYINGLLEEFANPYPSQYIIIYTLNDLWDLNKRVGTIIHFWGKN